MACQSFAMRRIILPLLFCCVSGAALAANSSTYTPFDLDTCEQTEKPDEYVFEGTWRCKGIAGYHIFQGGMDARSATGFGKDAKSNCSLKKTFSPFNTALSPIEWRMKDGLPIAAIERWSVVKDPEAEKQESVTWLVVNALQDGNSCHMHYVSGSFPNANEAARKAADEKAGSFDCMIGKASYDSIVGPPPIEMRSCMEMEAE
jgi:hypothetical protein